MLNPFRPAKPELIVLSQAPFNAEPALPALRQSFTTPQSRFYVRSHGEIPSIDARKHRLTVGGDVSTPLDLGVDELKSRFVHRTVTAVLQCAGNRRADLQQVRPTAGDPWAPGAIGNAEWTGVGLADVLWAAGASTGPGRHVAFQSADTIVMPGEKPFRFGVSVPAAKALAPEMLIAWAMNGEDLAPEHGFPLRLVVPGFAGVRWPKWLTGITVQDRPSDNHMQQRDYKMMPPEMREDTADWSKGVTIDDMPLNSAICEPAPYAELKPGRHAVRGYAVATARAVARVDVSADGGRNWTQAVLEPEAAPWSWTFWRSELDLHPGEHELAVRAWDSAGQTQPATPDEVWNFKGYLCASWHIVRVRVRA